MEQPSRLEAFAMRTHTLYAYVNFLVHRSFLPYNLRRIWDNRIMGDVEDLGNALETMERTENYDNLPHWEERAEDVIDDVERLRNGMVKYLHLQLAKLNDPESDEYIKIAGDLEQLGDDEYPVIEPEHVGAGWYYPPEWISGTRV